MLESFRARQIRVGVVGHLQVGRIKQTSSGAWMGQGVNNWIVTQAVKDPDGHNFAIDRPVMERLGERREVIVYAAFDSADQCSRIDRTLFFRGARACQSLDGKVATWRYNPDDDGNEITPLPEAFNELVVSRNGSSCEVTCQEEACPLVTDPLWTEGGSGKKTTWPCKPRGSFLFRLADAGHSGIYVYKTTSIPTTEAVYAMLAYLERVTHGNMVQVPLSLVMTQARPRHGRNVTRVNLQIACTLPEMIEHALVWKKQKHELDVDLDAAPDFEVADDDTADAEMFGSGDAETPPDEAPPPKEREKASPEAPKDQQEKAAHNDEGDGEPPGDAPKPYHDSVRDAMRDALKSSRWSGKEIKGMLQILGVERVTEAGPEKCQIMLEACAGAGPEWLKRYDKKDEVGQPALQPSGNGSGHAQPSPPYHDDDIPF
jgi:hypothetical protein